MVEWNDTQVHWHCWSLGRAHKVMACGMAWA